MTPTRRPIQRPLDRPESGWLRRTALGLALALGAQVPLAAAAAPPAVLQSEAASAAAELAAIADDLAAAQAIEQPWLPVLAGDLALAREVLGSPPAPAAAWTDTLRDLESRLRRVNRGDLDARQRARARSLAGWIRAIRTIADAQAARRTDALSITRDVERVLLALLGSPALPVQQRVRLGETYLGQVAAHWKAARSTLTTPSRAWALQAADELDVIHRLLLEDLTAATRSATLGERATTRIEKRLASAAADTRSLQAWLRAVPGATGRPRSELGGRALEVTVGALTGTPRSLSELRASLLDIVANDDLGRIDAAGAGGPQALGPEAILAAVQAGVAASRRLYAQADFAALGPEADVAVGTYPGGALPDQMVRLIYDAKGARFLLSMEVPDRSWPGSLLRGLSSMASPLTLQAEGLRRGAAGEALLRAQHASLPADARMPFLLEPFAQGFGLYSADAAVLHLLPQGEATTRRLAVGNARLRLLDAARFLASIELHADRLDDGEVVDAFRRRTGVSLDVARREIDRIWHEPLRGAGILGYIEYVQLERRLAQELPVGTAPIRTLALALGAPGVRPVDLIEELEDALWR